MLFWLCCIISKMKLLQSCTHTHTQPCDTYHSLALKLPCDTFQSLDQNSNVTLVAVLHWYSALLLFSVNNVWSHISTISQSSDFKMSKLRFQNAPFWNLEVRQRVNITHLNNISNITSQTLKLRPIWHHENR